MPLLFQLQFTTANFLWLLGCFALGLACAWLLYGVGRTLPRRIRRFLFAIRTLAITAISFLMFAPLVRTVSTRLEKPLIIIAQDNSASLGVAKPSAFNVDQYQLDLQKVREQLSGDFDVREFSFGATVDEGLKFEFSDPLTDISAVFKYINERFANRNLGAVILATDGIYNRGPNPQYESGSLRAAVYSVALGDTTARRDILISNVNYNNITYLDNEFQIEVGVEGYQARGSNSLLTVSDNGGVLFSRELAINSDEFRVKIPLTLLARKKGVQQYTVRVRPIANELSQRNNSQTIFIEVVDGRQQVLIIANSPHPDIAAIKQSIEINDNYNVGVKLADEVTPADIAAAGLVVLHQLPSQSNGAANILKMVSGKPVLYVLGLQSDVARFSSAQGLLGITSGGRSQEATVNFEPDFFSFVVSDPTRQKIANFAPLLSPFGNYALKGPANVLATQQIGRVKSRIPLMLFGEDAGRKIGVLAGEGLWRWRLEDFSENGSHDAVAELLTKSIQFLSTRDDKRRFRVYPARNAFDENEHVLLNAELYNDALELVNTPDANVSIKSSAGKSYSFTFSRTQNAYRLDAGTLPPGDYSFSANTTLGNNRYSATGRFVISQQDAEFRQTRANHQLLFAIARQSGGTMVYPQNVLALADSIRANENVKTVSYEDRRYEDLIDMKLIFFLILALLTAEWFLRKRGGEV